MTYIQSMKVVTIDPRSSYAYGSFYLYGLIKLFGEKNITFSLSPFKNLSNPGWNLRFEYIKNQKVTKVFISTGDSWQIQQEDYDWCDVYGCVNANFSHCPKEKYPKLVSLAPSFGINVYNRLQTILLALGNFIKDPKDALSIECWNKYAERMEVNYWKNMKHFFSRYYKTYKNRMHYEDYDDTNSFNSKDLYVFFLSTLWYSDEWNKNDKGVNLRRAWYIRSCKTNPNICFEGGLVGDTISSISKFQDIIANGVSMNEWMNKTKRSAFVFNTPAFWDCHGWKLGEYLAMGKCIISTPLSNDLPAPLVHGEHIHYVDSTPESINEAVQYITTHQEYRKHLEYGAKEYWTRYGTPIASLKILGIEN